MPQVPVLYRPGFSLGHLFRAMGRHQLCTNKVSAAAEVIRVHPHDACSKKLGIHLRGPKETAYIVRKVIDLWKESQRIKTSR